jgi:hypothetical protein
MEPSDSNTCIEELFLRTQSIALSSYLSGENVGGGGSGRSTR